MFDVPPHLHGIARDLQQRLDRIQAQPSNNDYRLMIDGEVLRFPYRIYADVPRLERLASSLQGDHRLLCLCLATRHPDGFLRQRAVEALGQASAPWVLAFHLALLNEYVEEIALVVDHHARQIGLAAYAPLVRENAAFFERCMQRAASYWNAYHRQRHPTLRTFPAHRLLLEMRRTSRCGGT
ncbi:hypothetical protein [Stenotrophomonas maltophilia]|uniref:hypothetical protein n=1 Tax=Stenotrophomonas maltophilia TaxID=40324 RepID=UPI0015DE68ED|nr:hypothetical protein [Stenotrophomonas maltophilia]MBA0448710.1 hypothetical protein [Stenotrophomonas maltophilia]